ncbi:sensor histidine kinase [Bacillus suaedae]|uniref:histidine kinase n=1 Tax=Halalkalibacter suaedae TaxID=2822140 RepID=A0A941AT69_9BACI|nr:HAMP domain-containing sensor histidine kinase [Bacillus suaedae]MBP3951044.1 HAMP domain-containing histidine kinase [Bacillus suaedae]
MVTKSKNSAKAFVWFLFLTCGIVGILTGMTHASNFNKGYFETHHFQSRFEEFLYQLTIFEIQTDAKEKAKADIEITSEEMAEYRNRFGTLDEQIISIQNQYIERINQAKEEGNATLAQVYIDERDGKLEEIKKNFEDDSYLREKMIKEQEAEIDKVFQHFEGEKQYFSETKQDYLYHLTNTSTGEVYKNVPNLETFTKTDMHTVWTYPADGYLTFPDRYLSTESGMMIPIIENNQYEGKIGVAESSSFTPAYENYRNYQLLFWSLFALSVGAVCACLFMNRKQAMTSRISLGSWEPIYRKIPIDFRLILFFIVSVTVLMAFFGTMSFITNDDFFIVPLALLIVLVPFWFIQGRDLLNGLRYPEMIIDELRQSMIIRMYQTTKGAFLNSRLGVQVFTAIIVIFLTGLGMITVIHSSILTVLYFLFILVVSIPFLFFITKQIYDFNLILAHTSKLARGKIEVDLPEKGRSIMANLARDLNQLKKGVTISLKEQAKSERLKTELITNVSHDLRTPLTSIISYTELLKSSKLAEDERQAYVQIIDRKSQRLKMLIDDLFEVSKMTSGNIELNRERVDITQLLQQALAEHNESIEKSALHFRISSPSQSIYSKIDGQKIWRVFDNLITNIIHYSLENTRAYISLKEDNSKAIITFKNVTKHELGDNVDELLERFKRGDSSRQTDGSGLGLAIAKSIIDLHHGSLNIDIDGDLFKVTVMLDIE